MRQQALALAMLFSTTFGVNHLSAQCLSGDCKNGQGSAKFNYKKNSSAVYTGTFKESQPHGKGNLLFSEGKKYEGEFAYGGFNGMGKMTLEDGTIIQGYWERGSYKSQVRPATQPAMASAEQAKKKLERPTSITTERVSHEGSYAYASTDDQNTEIQDFASGKAKIWALAIGVADYDATIIRPLKYTDDDAYRMLAFWQSPMGGGLDDDHAKALVDEAATRENVLNTMKDLFQKAGPEDLIVLYFSGHGLPGAFLPIDYDGFGNKITHKEVNQMLAQSRAKYKLCIADACHSGSLMAMKNGQRDRDAIQQFYKTLADALPGTALFMSSQAEEESLESVPLRQGVFSHYLLRGLKGEADADGNTVVSIQELYDFVSLNVTSFAYEFSRQQNPAIRGDYDPKMPVSVVKK